MKLSFRLTAVFLLAIVAASSTKVARAVTGAAGDSTLPSRNLPPGLTYVQNAEGIAEYSLDNGLRVILFPDPSKETTTINVTYLVGSRFENYGETGMAHLLEHLMFKGSTGHPKPQEELTSHGCRPNGSTWFDRTNYFETFAARDSNLVWALDFESDRMVHSYIAQADLNSEMTVVRNEYEAGENDPKEVLNDRILSTAYLWHNYGKSTIGARSDIEQVPIERLQAFYRNYYQPDNAVLVVAGMFDPARALSLVQQKFGRIPRPTRTLTALYTEEPAQDGERMVELRRVGDVQVAGLAYHIPAGPHPDFPALAVLAYILGDTPSGRLYKSLVESRKATSVSAWAMQFHDPGMLLITAEVRKEQPLDSVRDDLVRETEAAGASLPSSDEVNRAKQSLLKEWELALRNSERAAIGLSEWEAMGDWRLMFLHRDRLDKVTPQDVQRVAAAYLRPSNRTVGLFHPTAQPDRATVPTTPSLAEMLKDYHGGAGVAQGERFDPAPQVIESKIVRSELPVGLKLVLLPRKTRGATVQIMSMLSFGDENSLKGQSTAGELAASMLLRGTQNRTRQQITDEIDRLHARLRIFGDAQGVRATCEVERGQLPDALRLLAEVLRRPSFPPAEYEILKQEEIADREEDRTDPRALSMNTMQRHLNPWPKDDVRYQPTADEAIANIQATPVDQVANFHRDFYGASNGRIALVGDFDPAEVGALITQLFGDWKSPRPYARVLSPFKKVEPLHQLVETPDKESAAFQASLRIEMQDTDPDYPAMLLGNYMTGGGFLNSRLATRIRQKEGLSYGVGSFFFANAFNPSARFGCFAICAPQNASKVETAFREEMARIVKDGFTPEEIQKAKDGWLQQRQLSRSHDNELADQLVQRTEETRTLAWDEQIEKKVGDLTAGQILSAFRRAIDPDKISVVVAGDFEKAKQAQGPSTTSPQDQPGRSGGRPDGRGERSHGQRGHAGGTDPKVR